MTYAIGIIIAILAIWVLFKLLKAPIKIVWKLLLNALSGVITLFFINLLGGIVGLSLDINWVNALVAGILGLPGVIILLIVKYI